MDIFIVRIATMDDAIYAKWRRSQNKDDLDDEYDDDDGETMTEQDALCWLISCFLLLCVGIMMSMLGYVFMGKSETDGFNGSGFIIMFVFGMCFIFGSVYCIFQALGLILRC